MKKMRDLSPEEFMAFLIGDAIKGGRLGNSIVLHPNGDGFSVEGIIPFGPRDGKPGLVLNMGGGSVFKIHVTHESGSLPNVNDIGKGKK